MQRSWVPATAKAADLSNLCGKRCLYFTSEPEDALKSRRLRAKKRPRISCAARFVISNARLPNLTKLSYQLTFRANWNVRGSSAAVGWPALHPAGSVGLHRGLTSPTLKRLNR